MVELSLRERLQPLLLDRLVDDERVLTIFEVTLERRVLRRLGVAPDSLAQIISAQGLAILPSLEVSSDDEASAPVCLRFSAPNGRVSVANLKALVLKPPGAPEGIELHALGSVTARNVLNANVESSEERRMSMARLRECVCRDLAILLSSTSLDASYDLTALAEVRRSVLNYGMPSLAGRSVKSLDLRSIARTVEDAIRQFEPRLTHVRVTPDTERDDDEHEFHLRIDAQLWSQPASQRVVLRTRISTDSGQATVTDVGGR
jgi:type VI secretion system lysozyme-like protein